VVENNDSRNKTYYNKLTEVNAVQLISFNNEKKLLAFKNDYRDIELYIFQKRVEGKEYFVLTSKVFPTMTDANNFIDNLPRRMDVAQPWLIPVKMIQQHIESF
jgi:septal ring-binding cell division protein DamX